MYVGFLYRRRKCRGEGDKDIVWFEGKFYGIEGGG